MSDESTREPRRRRRGYAGVVGLGVLVGGALAWAVRAPRPQPPVVPPTTAAEAPAPPPHGAPIEPSPPAAGEPAEPQAGAPGVAAPEPAAGIRAGEPAAGGFGASVANEPGELLQTCELIAAKLASVTLEECTGSRLEPSAGRSVRGIPILVAEYPPVAEREPLGRVLLFGGIHGDELSSVSIVYTWLETLDRHHSGLFHWRVAPLLNPDGLLRESPQRMNERGVDLNRNFPSPNWMVEAPDYWIRRTSRNPRRYPGEAPLSEPESRWLDEQIRAFRPAAIVAVHAPHHVVDYDGPPEPPERLGPLHLHLMGTYPGSLGRYAGTHLGLPVVTIELPNAGALPSPDDQRRMWIDLVAWLRRSVPEREAERLARAAPAEPAVAAASMER